MPHPPSFFISTLLIIIDENYNANLLYLPCKNKGLPKRDVKSFVAHGNESKDTYLQKNNLQGGYREESETKWLLALPLDKLNLDCTSTARTFSIVDLVFY